MALLKWLTSELSAILLPLGGWGLLVVALLDSSFLSFAGGVDLWFISLSLLRPAEMPFYALAATLGSVAGCYLLYLAARKGEEMWLEKKRPQAVRLARVRGVVERWEAPAVLVAALLPPPAPFKAVVLAAGVLKLRRDKFLLALLVGRGIRYFGEGWLAVRYGRQVWVWLLAAGPIVFTLLLLCVMAIILVYSLRRRASVLGS